MKQHELEVVDRLSQEDSLRSSAVKLYLIRANKVYSEMGDEFPCVAVLNKLIEYATRMRDEIMQAEIDSGPKPFVDDRGRTVRFHHYEHSGLHDTSREVYSPETGKWYHETWV